jgi:hypothetical protein
VAESGDPRRWGALILMGEGGPNSGENSGENSDQSAMTFATEDGFATVSSSLIALPAPGRPGVKPKWLFAPGRPDETPYAPVEL